MSESGNKVCEKVLPEEAVGVVCRLGGRVQVVEYTEISQETSQLTTPDGKLTYKAGNICNHFFTRDFLKVSLGIYFYIEILRKKTTLCSESVININENCLTTLLRRKYHTSIPRPELLTSEKRQIFFCFKFNHLPDRRVPMG